MIDFFENILGIVTGILYFLIEITIIVLPILLFYNFFSNPFKKSKKNDGDNLDDISWYDAAHGSDFD